MGRWAREAAFDEAARAAASAVDESDFVRDVLPRIHAAIGGSVVCYYGQRTRGLEGALFPDVPHLFGRYCEHYLADDPIQAIKRRENPRLCVITERIERRVLERSAAYNEIYRPACVEQVLLARLSEAAFHSPGLRALFVARSGRDREWSRGDVASMRRMLSVLRGAVERFRVADPSIRRVVEGLFDRVDGRPYLVFSADGRLVWCSQGAAELAAGRLGSVAAMTDALAPMVRGTLAALRPRSSLPASTASAVTGLAGVRAHAFLVGEPRAGRPYVAVRLVVAGARGARLRNLASEHGLTARETAVLALLLDGLSNPRIAEALGVSRNTVRTHVGNVLGKLGVDSRLGAAALVRDALL